MDASLRLALIISASVGNVLFIGGLFSNYWLKYPDSYGNYNRGLWEECVHSKTSYCEAFAPNGNYNNTSISCNNTKLLLNGVI